MKKLQDEADRLGKSSFAFAFYMDTQKEERERLNNRFSDLEAKLLDSEYERSLWEEQARLDREYERRKEIFLDQ